VDALSGITMYAVAAGRAAADLNNFATSAMTLWDGRRALWILDSRQIELEV
jgi:hypothetical protein